MSTPETETPLPQHNIETPRNRNFVINEIENMRKYVQSLATEIKAVKLVMKEQLDLLKTSNSDINSNTDTDDSTGTKFWLRIKII